jgi:hypothetical protein
MTDRREDLLLALARQAEKWGLYALELVCGCGRHKPCRHCGGTTTHPSKQDSEGGEP